MLGQEYNCLAVLNVFVKPECLRCSSLIMFFLAPLGTRILLPSSMITSVSSSFSIDSCVATGYYVTFGGSFRVIILATSLYKECGN